MKIDGENLDSLRSHIRKLEHENKTLSKIICTKHNVEIKYLETDIDHIHYLISR